MYEEALRSCVSVMKGLSVFSLPSAASTRMFVQSHFFKVSRGFLVVREGFVSPHKEKKS